MRVRVFKVGGRDLFVLRHGDHFIASFTWERLLEKFKGRMFKPLGDTLRARFALGELAYNREKRPCRTKQLAYINWAVSIILSRGYRMEKHTIHVPSDGLEELNRKLEFVAAGRDMGHLNSYSEFVSKLFKDMDTPAASLMHTCAGIAGEGGEILDIAKKVWVYGKQLDVSNLVEELGDLRFYYQQVLNMAGLTDEHIQAHNMFKLSLNPDARFPGGVYTDAAAIARADKVAEGETVSSGVTAGVAVAQHMAGRAE